MEQNVDHTGGHRQDDGPQIMVEGTLAIAINELARLEQITAGHLIGVAVREYCQRRGFADDQIRHEQ
jgi:hypothetical protein